MIPTNQPINSIQLLGFIIASWVNDQVVIDDEIRTLEDAGAVLESFDEQKRLASVIIPVQTSIDFIDVCGRLAREFERIAAKMRAENEARERESN